MNIYHFMPFSVDFDYASEINKYVKLVPNDEDWICIYDGDTMRTRPSWGKDIEIMIAMNLEFDMLTIMSTRTGVPPQRLNKSVTIEHDLVKLHQMVEKQFMRVHSFKAYPIKRPLAGYFMAFRKKLAVEFPFHRTETGILGVDGSWTRRLIEADKKIGICPKLATIHFYRLNKKDRRDTSHLRRR